MSKELIERLRKFIGGELGNGAANALESLEAAYDSAVEAGKSLAKQAFKAERERDALALRVSELTCQIDRAEEAMVERDALAAELKALRGDQTPTTEDINLLKWKGMDGVFAFHAIERHADDWNHVARLMNAWLEANREELIAELNARREQEPVLVQHRTPIADMQGATVGYSEWKDGSGLKWWPRRHLYANPVPAREMTDADIALCIASADKSFAQERISGKPVLGVWSKHLARAIERHLKGEGE